LVTDITNLIVSFLYRLAVQKLLGISHPGDETPVGGEQLIICLSKPWSNTPVHVAAQPQLVLSYTFCVFCVRWRARKTHKTCITTFGRRRRPICTGLLPLQVKRAC